jgi:hypothetical protein
MNWQNVIIAGAIYASTLGTLLYLRARAKQSAQARIGSENVEQETSADDPWLAAIASQSLNFPEAHEANH